MAKNKQAASHPRGRVGPHISELARVAQAAARLDTSIELDLGRDRGELSLMAWHHPRSGLSCSGGWIHTQGNHTRAADGTARTVETILLELAGRWPDATPRLDTVSVSASKCPLPRAALKHLATAAWCEAFGVEVPTPEASADRERAQRQNDRQLREEMRGELRGGAAGLARWNARPEEERRKAGSFRGEDFSGADLAGANLHGLDFEGATFDGACLRGANLGGCRLKDASFRGANLEGARLARCKPTGADFEGARLVNCNLRAASYRRVSFRNANLEGAAFDHTDLGGADLTGATLKGNGFYGARYDEGTRLPAGFTPPEGMRWKGVGPVPGTAPAPGPSGSTDLAAFVHHLAERTDHVRLARALKMLKAERFQLFAEVGSDSIVGVVRSQTVKDRVYSCRLASDGSFACCTQNLKPCGGQRGAICKHLLVLLIGLAKAGRLDPVTAEQWVQTSEKLKPAINAETMSETFLRYKGAEAGEIDWRPTETLPEDYYAL
jgi:uncharacterized protein YjbI with pentapeptide repeats